MRGNIHQRLFERLADLIPAVGQPVAGASFYAPPRVPGDIACYAVIGNVVGGISEVEIAHDSLVDGDTTPSPWMSFRVDHVGRTAELLAIEDRWRYEVVYCEQNTLNPRTAQLNAYAINCLTVMMNLGGVFRSVDITDTTTA